MLSRASYRAFLTALVAALVLGLGSVRGQRPPRDKEDIPVTGHADKRLAPFDKMMTTFLARHPRVPGAALAVARDGKVVYARGFGHADHERTRPVPPEALFRIASVSKPLTAVAVLRLAEQGKLRLNDRVFQVLDLREKRDKGAPFDERWRKVTLLQLLRHTGGWDRDKSFDPMFVSPDICKELKVEPPAKQDAIIRYMLRRPLDFDPGERYAYSNFGYCLLGRVIEKVSGRPYEEYVRQEVLAPVGAKSTRLGKTLLADKLPREVWYDAGNEKGPAVMGPNLGKPVLLPYGAWCLEAMDSHGGWVASASDLVRFASAFDHPEACKLLNAKSINQMFARPPGEAGFDKGKPRDAYYACGWEVRPYPGGKRNTWHSGSLDGTSTLLVRRADGLTWAVLFNSRGAGKGPEPADIIDPLVHKAADAVKNWP